MSMAVRRAGFIGLGRIGEPMARRINEAGFPLTVWARRTEAAQPRVAAGAELAGSVAEVGAACDYVGVCVLDDAAVAEICDELIPAMRPGSLLAIHATIAPASCEALEARCAERGIAFCDAPVDGGPDDAAAGRLVVMCGGTAEAVAAARPVLEAFGRLIVHLGPAGAGERAKIICNSLLAANLGLARAAMSLGDAFGLDRAQLHEVLMNGAAQSNGLFLFPLMTGPNPAPLLHKDTALMRDAGQGNAHSEMIVATARHWLDHAKSL
jgi:3-hydroxyisobutyrate dehydrogenase-like beta-hydroxyacid dehydrogenase